MNVTDVLENLAALPTDGVVVVGLNHGAVTPASEAEVLRLDEHEQAQPIHSVVSQKTPGKHYLLEVDLIREVVEAFREMRGRMPTAQEALEAIAFYVENDAFITD